ncbi:MAG TPA: D-2-hydroxyacid dehydrogenase [Acetobacteraceae bacterium]|jgi:phosphoglycerate dehydrogenase-like enzyme|nr:D-2-hydroxyacid dehydrogenase [Acetobacteraceae bacterium]
MRVHIQNGDSASPFDVTPAQWDAAAARSGRCGLGVTFADTRAGFADGLAEAELLVTAPGILARLLPLPPNRLGTIFLLAAGLDRLAPFDWLPTGVAIWNNRGAHGDKTGEYAIMAILMLATRLPNFIAAQSDQKWKPIHTPVVRGLRLTVIGTGDLGSSAARRARPFGIVATGVRRTDRAHPDFDRIVTVAHLDSVIRETDILLIACPLTDATRNLIDSRRLRLLAKDAGVINIGRGAVLDQSALCDRLDSGDLAGAILDVTDPEPPPLGHRLWSTPRLLLTPHVSADDPHAYNHLSLDILFDDLKRVEAGEPASNRVDLARGY